jgi:hypothetical protein
MSDEKIGCNGTMLGCDAWVRRVVARRITCGGFLWRTVLPYYVVILDNPEMSGVPGNE